jgi:molybdate transport system substrate-binding protein
MKVLAVLLSLALGALPAPPARAAELLVFAAASLTEALDAVNAGFKGAKITTSYAGSSALARQIEAGAPADVFISANPGWMDRLQKDGLIVAGTRHELLTNHLVVIGHKGAKPFTSFSELDAALGKNRLALAMTKAVPAGIYARQALTAAGLWDRIAPRVAEADNVRAALRLVDWNEAPYGIVYSTDAVADKDKVTVVWRIDDSLHDPIRYPVGLVKGAHPAAADYLAYLRSPAAAAIFARYGFGVAK